MFKVTFQNSDREQENLAYITVLVYILYCLYVSNIVDIYK